MYVRKVERLCVEVTADFHFENSRKKLKKGGGKSLMKKKKGKRKK